MTVNRDFNGLWRWTSLKRYKTDTCLLQITNSKLYAADCTAPSQRQWPLRYGERCQEIQAMKSITTVRRHMSVLRYIRPVQKIQRRRLQWYRYGHISQTGNYRLLANALTISVTATRRDDSEARRKAG